MSLKQQDVYLHLVRSVTKIQLLCKTTLCVNGIRETLRRVRHTLFIYGEFKQHIKK